MEGKNPKSEYEQGDSSRSSTNVDLPEEGNQNVEIEENKEDYEDLESVTDLLILGLEFEIEDQGDEGVVLVVDN
jgi:uncharacterized FlaG/YvyC family protein